MVAERILDAQHVDGSTAHSVDATLAGCAEGGGAEESAGPGAKILLRQSAAVRC